MEEPVGWGVLGAAGIAVKRVIPAMRETANCRVVAIASRDQARARAAAEALGVERAYGAYEALLADPEIEAVYIPLPNPMHVEWSLRALDAGKHVLCEKPIGMNAAEARTLVAARDRTGLIVEEAFPFPNHPQWSFIRETVRSGALGELRAITAVAAYDNTDPGDIRNNPAMGGGALYDLGCYLINACRIVFEEEPRRAIGLFGNDPRFGVDRLTSFMLDFPRGHANLTVSTQGGPNPTGTHQHFGVLGSHGWLRADFPFSHPVPTACSVYIGDAGSWGSFPAREARFPPLNQYALQAGRFSRLVRGEAVEAWPIENAVSNMRVIDAVFRSAKSQAWEAV